MYIGGRLTHPKTMLTNERAKAVGASLSLSEGEVIFAEAAEEGDVNIATLLDGVTLDMV